MTEKESVNGRSPTPAEEDRMAKDAYVRRSAKHGRKRGRYIAKIQKITGIPLENIVEAVEASGMEFRSCIDVPGAPEPHTHTGYIQMLVSAPGGVGSIISFSLPQPRACRAKQSARRSGV
jgi:signal recognition particle subunit SEC65